MTIYFHIVFFINRDYNHIKDKFAHIIYTEVEYEKIF